jgi:uncharacterized membrane protein
MIRTIVTQVIEMAALRRRAGLLLRAITEFPADLVVVLLYTLVSSVLLARPALSSDAFRTALALPLLFVVPGYVLLAVLFPRRSRPDPETASPLVAAPTSSLPLHARGIDGVERGLLSFGLSLVLAPLLAVTYALLPVPFTPQTAVAVAGGFVLCCIAAGAISRAAVPREERFSLPLGDYAKRARAGLTETTKLDAGLNVLLAISVVVGLSAVGYAAVNPQDATRYTEVTLLTETDSGDLVAGDYPDDFVRGEPQPLTVSVTNREDARQTYEVVVVVQRVQDESGSPTVLEQRRVDDFSLTVDAGETARLQHAAQSPISGENLRLVYLVYDGTPPDRPTTDNAYRYVHLWIDVSDPA